MAGLNYKPTFIISTLASVCFAWFLTCPAAMGSMCIQQMVAREGVDAHGNPWALNPALAGVNQHEAVEFVLGEAGATWEEQYFGNGTAHILVWLSCLGIVCCRGFVQGLVAVFVQRQSSSLVFQAGCHDMCVGIWFGLLLWGQP